MAASAVKYELLVTDMDGTLLNEEQEVSPANARALRRLAAAGRGLALATGRMEASVAPYVRQLDVSLPAILYNGARIVDFADGRVLYEKSLQPAAVEAALDFLRSVAVDVNVYAEGKLFVREKTGPVREFESKERIEAEAVGDLARFVRGSSPGPVTKLLIIGTEAEFAAIRRGLDASAFGARLVNSDPAYLELLPADASKGEALAFLADEVGVPLANIVAMGDAQNDLEMLQRAGLGVAVANAHPEVLAAADYVAPAHHRDATAHVVERFFLR